MALGGLSLQRIEPVFNKIGELPQNQRIMAFVGTFVLLIGAFFYFSFLPKLKNIDQLDQKSQKLDADLFRIKADAAKLEKFRKEYNEAEKQFNIVKRKLPEKDEIPSLLESISRSGQDVGLEFELFQPKGETKKGFYAEISVAINVVGSYHNVARFFDRVSRLSRIVTIKNIVMTPKKTKGGENLLDTKCTAVTYKFVES